MREGKILIFLSSDIITTSFTEGLYVLIACVYANYSLTVSYLKSSQGKF